jgi:hypothetical protein
MRKVIDDAVFGARTVAGNGYYPGHLASTKADWDKNLVSQGLGANVLLRCSKAAILSSICNVRPMLSSPSSSIFFLKSSI